MTDESPAAPPAAPQPPRRVRTRHFARAKAEGVKITGLTCYDMLTAHIFDEAGIDFLLVGDSVGNNVLGYDTTLPVTVDELIPLARAVAGATQRAFVVVDMPFGSYETNGSDAVHTAIKMMKLTGAHAVKLEGGVRSAEQIRRIVEAGIPVMGHIGYTPQSEHQFGGHIVQGRGDAGEEKLLADARAVAEAGAFSVVLEMVPAEAARQVTEAVSIPTISVGAGPHTDGQLLVWTDWAGLSTGRIPSFVKKYADLAGVLSQAARTFKADVESGSYPDAEHSF